MGKLFSALIRTIWSILLPVPMPWRAGLILSILTICTYQIAKLIFPILLLPEFLITSKLRKLGYRPLPGVYTYGDAIIWLIKVSYRISWIGLLTIGLSIIIYFLQPSLQGTPLDSYISRGLELWSQLEEAALANK
jgi:hypothetical protein